MLHTWPLAQVVPHAPQLLVEVSWVSQPLAALPSQLPKPALHVPIAQTPPLLQVAAALAKVQAALHAPQLESVLITRSQPLLGRPSQSSKPAVHAVMSQPLPVQVAIATLGSAEQLVLQSPQVAGALVFASQPLFGIPSQSRKPLWHVKEQSPAEQPALVVFGRPVQSALQLPQLVGNERLVSQLVLSLLQSS